MALRFSSVKESSSNFSKNQYRNWSRGMILGREFDSLSSPFLNLVFRAFLINLMSAYLNRARSFAGFAVQHGFKNGKQSWKKGSPIDS